jgi:SAM-dependent methyltransferase
MSDANGRDVRRMYSDLAWAWPIISPPEDYVGEAEEIVAWFREHAHGPIRTLLHLGCGGGHLDRTLKQHLEITAFDISDQMLALARALNPEVDYRLGDMRDIRISTSFDAVLIADSIAYMSTEDDLRAAFQTAFEHVRPGGCFITYAEYPRERFVQNTTVCSAHSRDEVHISLTENYFDPDPGDTTIEGTFVYLIRRDGDLEVAVDRHVGGIFPLSTWTRLLKDVRFEILAMPESSEAVHFICRRV